jgi:LAS superfamily LD-carboxypeptidase LdcB
MATPSLKSQAQEERALEMTKYTQPMDGKSGIPPMDLTVQEAARHWETARKHEREARKHLSQAIRDARAKGETLSELSLVLGVSRQRVEQLGKN